MSGSWEDQLQHQKLAAKRGDVPALSFLKRFGPHGCLLSRIANLEREVRVASDELDKLPALCEEHIAEKGGGGEAWIETCVLCGKTEMH